mgnify:FL=1
MNAIKGLAGGALLLAAGSALAAAGDMVVTFGAVNIDNSRSYSTPQRNEVTTSIATRTGLVPSRFESPGTEETIGNAVKPILTLTYFMTDHWAVTVVGGVPPKLDVIGHGSVVTPGALTKIVPAVQMGKAANNPVATIRHWYPSAMIQYYFGEQSDSWHPFVGAGLGFSFFTDVKLEPNFDANLKQAGNFLALATTLDPHNTTEAKASSAFRPIFNAGVAYHLNNKWSMSLAASYVPIKTTSTIRVRDKTGNVVLISTADLDIPTVATSATVGFHF